MNPVITGAVCRKWADGKSKWWFVKITERTGWMVTAVWSGVPIAPLPGPRSYQFCDPWVSFFRQQAWQFMACCDWLATQADAIHRRGGLATFYTGASFGTRLLCTSADNFLMLDLTEGRTCPTFGWALPLPETYLSRTMSVGCRTHSKPGQVPTPLPLTVNWKFGLLAFRLLIFGRSFGLLVSGWHPLLYIWMSPPSKEQALTNSLTPRVPTTPAVIPAEWKISGKVWHLFPKNAKKSSHRRPQAAVSSVDKWTRPKHQNDRLTSTLSHWCRIRT